MEKSKKYKTRLGAGVIGGALLLVGAIYFISKNQSLFADSFRVCAIFPDLGGLQIGDKVRFNGLNIGTVDGVALVNDSTVVVNLLIERDMQVYIKKDAAAMISAEGLMGSKTMSIIPGRFDQPVIEENDTLITTAPISMDDILSGIKVTAGNAKVIAQNISAISQKMRNKKGMIGKMMYDKRFTSNIDSAMNNFKSAKDKLSVDNEVETEAAPVKNKKGIHLFGKKKRGEGKDSVGVR